MSTICNGCYILKWSRSYLTPIGLKVTDVANYIFKRYNVFEKPFPPARNIIIKYVNNVFTLSSYTGYVLHYGRLICSRSYKVTLVSEGVVFDVLYTGNLKQLSVTVNRWTQYQNIL